MSIWDDPELAVPTGSYVKWDDPKNVVGKITSITKGTDANGGPCAVLGIETDDGDEVLVSVAQYQLKVKVAELRPNVGDRIAIAYLGAEKIDGGKTVKTFEVETKPAAAAAKPSSLL